SSLALTASGTPLGAKSPNQKRRSTSAVLTPASLSVGTFGRTGERSALVTASPLILPASMRPFATWIDAILRATCPAITSFMAGPPPLWGAWTRLHSRARLYYFKRQMRDAADAGGGVIYFLRQCTRIRDEFRHRIGFHVVGDCQNQGRCRGRCDRVVVLDRIEG